MEKKFVITINRYCGSGGGTVGRKIAEKLGVNFYDKELIELEGAENGMDVTELKAVNERVKNSLHSRINKGEYNGCLISPDDPDYESYQKMYEIQANIIKDIAERENCVVVGRCANHILRHEENIVSVFITAKSHTCIHNEMQRLGITNKQAKERVKRINDYRKAYYHHHTNRRWNSTKRYDISLSTEKLSYDDCAEIIIDYLNRILSKED